MCTHDECGRHERRALLKSGLALTAMGLSGVGALAAETRSERKGTEVRFPTALGEVAGYLALPDGAGRHPAVLVLHGNWGMPEHDRITADELAEAGLAALLVSRFSRIPNFGWEQMQADNKGPQHYLSESFFREGLQEVRGAIDFLAEHPRVSRGAIGAVGFCGGGIQAIRQSLISPEIGALVSFYGPPALPPQYKHRTDPITDLVEIGGQVKAPLQIHYGLSDYAVKAEDVERLAAQVRGAGTEVEIHAYAGATHAFYDTTNMQAPPANARAADAARPLYLAFLHRHLG